LNPQSKH